MGSLRSRPTRGPRTLPAAAAIAFLAGLASANPVPWINLGVAINSRGLYGDPNNTLLITPNIPAGGPFTYMTISGSLTEVSTATFASEACIEVTTPSGQAFVVKPFTTGGFTGTIGVPGGSVTIPLSGNFGSGAGTLRFFELYLDSGTGADSQWNNLQITLHNAAGGDVTPMDAQIAPSAEGPDVSPVLIAQLVKGATPGSFMSFGTSRVVGKVHMRGFGTAMGGWNTSSTNSQLGYVNVNITAPRADFSGPVTWTVAPFGFAAASSSQFDLVVDTPVPVLTGPGNDWTFTVTETGAPAVVGMSLAQVQMAFQPLPPNPPAASDLGTIRSRPALGPVDTTVVSSTTFTAAPASVVWYTFTTDEPCSNASGYWLDIHTQIPAGSAAVDQEIGVYDASGNRQAADDDSGSNNRSLLSFGQTSPVRPEIPPVEFPGPRNGFNGNLAPGLHYLAVGQYNLNFALTGWHVYNTGTPGSNGDITFEFRTNLPPLLPPLVNLGTIRTNTPVSVPVNVAPGEVKWFRFDIDSPINNVTRYYLDIDTIAIGAPFADTMLGFYSGGGVVLRAEDDDGGNGNRSQLSFGIGPANRSPIGSSASGDGRDGNLVAGTYYLATGLFGSSGMTFANEWFAASTGAVFAGYPLNFRTNLPNTGCGPADIGSAGGVPGSDGLLDNNDFIAFITKFFDMDSGADLGVAGGFPGSDGLWDNNDFIAFITLFFNGCP